MDDAVGMKLMSCKAHRGPVVKDVGKNSEMLPEKL